MSLQNKVVLITGGTGALGRTVVDLFLNAGADVLTTYHREQSFVELSEAVSSNDRLKGFQVDLTLENEVDVLFDTIKKSDKTIEAFIHLAGGFWMGGTIAETPVREWDKMIDMNLKASFLVCRRAFRLMQEGTGGHIVTISAKPALEMTPGMGAYAVSKAAVLALTEILSREGSQFNISANSILPGVIDTPANREAITDADFDTWVKPREIAETIYTLINNTGVSGSIIKMYGKI